jgi:hypothetical protein
MLKAATALFAAVALSSVPALACTGAQVDLQSNPSWQTNQGSTISFIGDSLQLTPSKGGAASALYQAGFFDAADVCVDIVTPATVVDPTAAFAGIEFGVNQQSGEYYAFVISAAGSAGVMHHLTLTGNDLTIVTPFAMSPAVKTTANATNTLHLTWTATSATAYVNDQQFATFSFSTLHNTLFGLYAQGETSKTAAATWNFTNLQIGNSP